jgi:hypothetical protein
MIVVLQQHSIDRVDEVLEVLIIQGAAQLASIEQIEHHVSFLKRPSEVVFEGGPPGFTCSGAVPQLHLDALQLPGQHGERRAEYEGNGRHVLLGPCLGVALGNVLADTG